MDPDVPEPESLIAGDVDRLVRSAIRAAHMVGARRRPGGRLGAGRTLAWMKVNASLGDDQLLQRCWLAYLSDDLPTDAAQTATHIAGEGRFTASLDHSMWFHRPVRADMWHLHDFTCHSYVGGRALAIGHVFAADGVHVATVAQEVLIRGHPGEQTADHVF